ncbi:hypothetical protein Scep_015177 [Stephania cephalantha]|uniref:Aminotransferase-like plant mobile domain-containing protein n=1 Tax=Stephania cephalantha TaxID=152367 RepID=A0AAP0J592_9MAGN
MGEAKKIQVNKSKESHPGLGDADGVNIGPGISEVHKPWLSDLCLKDSHNILRSIVERWQSETNTFHLPFGEMTITLENVLVLLDILITGKTVVAPFKAFKLVIVMVNRLLEVLVTDADEEIRARPSLAVSLTWLKDRFSVPKKRDEEHNGKRAPDVYPSRNCLVRAYVLYLLGATLFSNMSGAEHTYQSTTTTISQSDGGTTSTEDVPHYDHRKEKRPLGEH